MQSRATARNRDSRSHLLANKVYCHTLQTNIYINKFIDLPEHDIRDDLCLHMVIQPLDKRLAVHEQFLPKHR